MRIEGGGDGTGFLLLKDDCFYSNHLKGGFSLN